MTFSKIGRLLTALVATAALGLGMTACGGGTIGYMWVLGTYYNQITGFLIDDYTGNLTAIQHSPFSSGGTNPVAIVVKPAGRYVYVINSGAAPVSTTGNPGSGSFVAVGSGITEFSVGSGGILTFEQTFASQGVNPVWAAVDSSGNYLYVLDKYAADYCGAVAPATCPALTAGGQPRGQNLNGAITAFSIASDTGRLTLVPNTTILSGGLPQNWIEVGPNPMMTKAASGCLYTLSPNSIFPYAVNGGNGQLTIPTTGPYQVTGSNSLSSINTSGGGGYIYLTDYGANQIFSLTAAGGSVPCSLTPVNGSQQTNVSGTLHPVNSITSTSGKFLYVINQTNLNTIAPNQFSTISAFTITGGQLATLADTTNNPYAVGSGPVCIVQDPTNQYLYTSNSVDSTVTGKLLDQNRGYLSDLQRGSTFPVTKTPTCLAISGNI